MATPGSGLASQLTSPVAETSFGVVPTALASTTKFSAFKSETLNLHKVVVQGMGLFAGDLVPRAARRVVTGWTVDGGIPMDLPARGLQQWLYPMFGSYGQTAAALTEDASTGAYKAVHALGSLQGNSFALQKGVRTTDGTTEPVTYVGCKIPEWELSCEKQQIAELQITIDARNELAGSMNSDPLNASLPGLVTYVQPPAGGVFHFLESTVYTGGTPSTAAGVTTLASPTVAGNITQFSVKQTRPLDVERFFSGGAGFKSEQVENALGMVTGQFATEWLSAQTMYDAFAADTATAVEYTFLGPAIGSGSDFSTLSILVPNIHLDAAPVETPGPGVITQVVPWTGLNDGTNNVIQATYWTLDSA